MFLKLNGATYQVATFIKASMIFLALRDLIQIEGEDAPPAEIFEGERKIATISPNGDVWTASSFDGAMRAYKAR